MLLCAFLVGQKISIFNEHKSYVQGVTWDPLGQYIATLSCDRCVSDGRIVFIYLKTSAEVFYHNFINMNRGLALILSFPGSFKGLYTLLFLQYKKNWKLIRASA